MEFEIEANCVEEAIIKQCSAPPFSHEVGGPGFPMDPRSEHRSLAKHEMIAQDPERSSYFTLF